MGACTDSELEQDTGFDVLGEGAFDVDLATANTCGGPSELTLNGEPAQPGDACGPCDDGVVACVSVDRLQCIGGTALNACGGCDALEDAPGDVCGACGFGALECDGLNGLECLGDRDTNACGGCLVVPAAPDEDCGTELEPANWVCASPDDIRCISAGQNACGGAAPLSDYPGTLCGECGRGFLSCVGTDALVCDDEQAGVNACGGCQRLRGQPGTSCGDCGGFYECDEDGAVVCNRQRNACGGCGALGGEPGAACGGGNVWVCTVGANVFCAPSGANVCGGVTELEADAGAPCGVCGDGIQTCVDRESTACLRATELNACGTCGVLAGTPGERCAANAVFVCNEGEAVCESALDVNACGGSTLLGAVVGAPCGLCDTGRLVCAGTESLGCAGEDPLETYTWFADADGDGFYTEGAASEVLCEMPDEGFAQAAGDCDDDNEDAYPEAPEDACVDQADLDCDGVINYVDQDRDGASACFDCADTDPRIRPTARELCDGIDQDCDAVIDEGAKRTFYQDADSDGFGDSAVTSEACAAPTGYVPNPGDCDDADPGRNPDAVELCDGTDNRCDGDVDPATAVDALDWYVDADGDGFGAVIGLPQRGCTAPEPTGWANNNSDCNDDDPLIHPDADEVCDGVDNNCDRAVDDDGVDRYRRYADTDGDGFGDAAAPALVCGTAVGYSDLATDCDDSRNDTWPGAPERIGDGVDQDCNRLELCYLDVDGDGFVGDFVTLAETTDLTCGGLVACPASVTPYRGDGQCYLSPGTSAAEDCDDTDPFRAPGLPDAFGDGVDSNCDGTEVCFRDLDGDRYRPHPDAIVLSADGDCTDPGELDLADMLPGEDCWDAEFEVGDGTGCQDVSGGLDPAVCPNEVNPGVTDEASRAVDGVDYDCNASLRCHFDADRDLFRTEGITMTSRGVRDVWASCDYANRKTQYAPVEFEWCDASSSTRPGLPETAFDGTDSNCDGVEQCYVDRDGDSYRAAAGQTNTETSVTCTESGCTRGRYAGEGSDGFVSASPLAFNMCPTARGLAVSSTPGNDCNDQVALTNPSAGVREFADISPSDPSLFDTDCDGRDGDANVDEYVTCASGSCAGSSVQAAIDRCRTKRLPTGRSHCTVFLQRGTYSLSGSLSVSGTRTTYIAGGYDSTFVSRRYGLSTDGWSSFGNLTSQTSLLTGATPAVTVTLSANTVELTGVRVQGANGAAGTAASPNGRPSIGVYTSGFGTLNVVRSMVRAGTGGTGHNFSVAAGTGSGTTGGTGGYNGGYTDGSIGSRRDAGAGSAGGPSGTGGGGGGAGTGNSASVCDGGNCAGDLDAGRAAGGNGGAGVDGACATAPIASSTWPGTMSSPSAWGTARRNGTDGGRATAGGGGGGGSWLQCSDSSSALCGAGGTWGSSGGTGGRGGDGGGSGLAGVGGGHGGPSIAVAAHAVRLVVTDGSLTSARGGTGGNGQAGGDGGDSDGGDGPSAGSSNPGNGSTIPSATGGTGGKGGAGGGASGGPGGHGGASLPILLSGGATLSRSGGSVSSSGTRAGGGTGGSGGARGASPVGAACTAAAGPNGNSGVAVSAGYNLSTGTSF